MWQVKIVKLVKSKLLKVSCQSVLWEMDCAAWAELGAWIALQYQNDFYHNMCVFIHSFIAYTSHDRTVAWWKTPLIIE